MKWYKSLDVHMKIEVKDCFKLVCGVGFGEVGFIIPFDERINLMYEKLQLLGFNI